MLATASNVKKVKTEFTRLLCVLSLTQSSTLAVMEDSEGYGTLA